MDMNAPSVVVDEAAIDALFKHLDSVHAPGAVVGVAVKGVPVYRKAFGLAHMELPVALTPSMRLRIGSTTKHFAVLAYLLLCEEGRATLDDPIGKYLPEFHPVTHAVTMRQLMGHIGGVRDAYNVLLTFCGIEPAISADDAVGLYRDMTDVNDPPGVTWLYNNGGYKILTHVIERIAGRSLEDILRERILAPVGMHDTLLRRTDTDFVPNSATLHMSRPGGGFIKAPLGVAVGGEGGMVSTVDDMLRWLAHMDAPVIGRRETWTAMTTPLRLSNGTSTNYGLGLIVADYRGMKTISHAGGVVGGNSQMIKVPAAGLDIAVMVNRHDVSGMALAARIIDVCVPGLAPTDPTAGRATGVFRSAATGRVMQLMVRDGLQFVAIDGAEQLMTTGADGILRPAPPKAYVQQSVTLSGPADAPTALVFSDFGNVNHFTRIPRVDAASPPAGDYHARTLGIDAMITATSHLITRGRFGTARFRLEPLARDIWLAHADSPLAMCAVISLSPQGFTFTASRMRDVAFERKT